MSRNLPLTLVLLGLLLSLGAAGPTIAAPQRDVPWGVDARIEIVWPHGNAPVSQARRVNITAYLFLPDTRVPVPCDYDNEVWLWQALNNEPAQPVMVGERRTAQVDGFNLPVWDFNNVDVSPATDPANKIYFYLIVNDTTTFSNVWTHASDARTYLPAPPQPEGVSQGLDDAEARILIVWPHDDAGRPQPVNRATKVNVTAAIFRRDTLIALDPDPMYSPGLWRSLNNDVGRGLGGGTRRMVSTSYGAYPVWDFNDIDVSAARDGANKFYFRVSLNSPDRPSSVWSHGADARTYFPQPDRPSSGCELGQTSSNDWQVSQLVVAPGQPGPLYALMTRPGERGEQRLFVSGDGGATWQPFAGGLPPVTVRGLTMDYATQDTLYAASDQGVFRWTGRAWDKVSSQPTLGLAVPTGAPSTLWAVEATSNYPNLIYSPDAGRTWENARLIAYSVALDPRDNQTVFAVYGYKGAFFTFRRAPADISIPPDQRYWTPLPSHTTGQPRGWTIDGATGDIYAVYGPHPQSGADTYQLWRVHQPAAPNVADIRWELLHDFGAGNQALLLGSGWGPTGLTLYALIGPAPFCPGGVCLPRPPMSLHRSRDGGQTWTPLPQPTP